MHISKKVKAPMILLLAAAMCSIGGVCIKMSVWQPLSINAARGLIAACITFVYMRKSGKPLKFNFSILYGALSLCLTMLLHVLANRLTSAAHAILLMYTSPLFVLLFLWIFLHKRPVKREAFCALAIIGGVALIGLDGLLSGNFVGDFIALLSGVAYAGVFLVNAGKNGDAFSSYFLGQLAAGIIGLPSLFKETQFTATAIFAALLLGVFQLGFSYILMAKGLENTPPAAASIITAAEPVLSPLWVWLFFKETVSIAAMLGAAMVIISIMVNALGDKKTVCKNSLNR